MGNKIYFVSDFHLGIPDHDKSLEREKKLVAWLDMIRPDAKEIYLMGDLFDFWFEYRTAVPKGYVRLLGKLAKITDSGTPVHLFLGNHDMWAFNYLSDELNLILHGKPLFTEFSGKKFYLAHGDGLGPGDRGYKFIKRVFACKFNQWLFGLLHPDLGIRMALFWSRKSRNAAMTRQENDEERNLKLISGRLAVHSVNLIEGHPELDFLVYGHYHYPLDLKLSEKARQIVLGDWLTHYSYAVFDGINMELKVFEHE